MIPLIGLTIFTSGMALFIYQMLWLRQLGFTDDTSIASTFATFFIGLALGGVLAQSGLKRGLNGLKGFVFTQVLITVSAPLLLPQLISPEYIDFLYGKAGIFLISLIPATALGMAFPLLTSWLATYKPSSTSSTIGFLYGLMLLGGAIGILLNSIYIVPTSGLNGAIYSAAGLNLFSAFIALFIYLKTQQQNSLPITPTKPKTIVVLHPTTILIILALISFTTMGVTIVWTRFISLYTGTTLFSISTILATILLGLALGALLVQQWQNKQNIGYKQLFFLLFGLFITLNTTHYLFTEAHQLYSSSQYLGELLNHPDALLFALTLFTPSLVLGAITTLSLSLYCRTAYEITLKIGGGYSLILIASTTGAVVTALWLVPSLGSNTTLLLFSTVPLILAFLLMLNINHLKKHTAYYILLGACIVVLYFIPRVHLPNVFKQHYYRYIDPRPPLADFYLKEGQAGLISFTLHKLKSSRLKINGLTQSKILAHRTFKGEPSEILSGALPYLLQENATNALVLGFQTGITSRILSKSDLEGVVKIVESEPKIVEAMMTLDLLVNFPFLEDGRADIEYSNFRTSLRKETERYSIITTQAPYAWLTGSTQFYSQEFFKLVKTRLKEKGLFSYHFSLLRIDTQALKSILKTFYSVFPTGAIFSDLYHGNLILLGGSHPLIIDFEKVQEYYKLDSYYQSATAGEMLRFGNIRSPQELLNKILFSSKQVHSLVKESKIITDSNLLIESRIAPLSERLPKNEHDPYEFIKQHAQKITNQ